MQSYKFLRIFAHFCGKVIIFAERNLKTHDYAIRKRPKTARSKGYNRRAD